MLLLGCCGCELAVAAIHGNLLAEALIDDLYGIGAEGLLGLGIDRDVIGHGGDEIKGGETKHLGGVS